MTLGDLAVWLPLVLLLLWFPGCSALTGPSTVTGTVGESLSLQCQYEEKYKTFDKYWCRKSKSFSLICGEKVEIKGSESRARKGRMSITDHPENLTLTVTLANLTLKDADFYWCGISTPWIEGRDDSLRVQVFVIPASTTSIPEDKTWTTTTTTTTKAVPFTNVAAESPTQESSSQEDYPESQGSGPITLWGSPGHPTSDFWLQIWVPVTSSGSLIHWTQNSAKQSYRFIVKDKDQDWLYKATGKASRVVSLLALLLLLLVGASLLAWRMFQKRVKAGKSSELSGNLRQAAEQSEPQYANLQLHTWSLQEEPMPPRQVEVEYSTVAFPADDLHYSSVVFDSQKQNSNTNGISSQRPREEMGYSGICKPRDSP
uniref:CMRF35-like molecule 8 n=2 Tax=Castor canadensis TaxID=51338 RepID=A0A8B7W076_CASCN|nr:CMRF35-like molecule 8 [Castor canadensis]